MFYPRLEPFHTKSEVIDAVTGRNRVDAASDQMQFLNWTESKPGPGKGKRRAGQVREPENLPVKGTTPLHIVHEERRMV